MEAKARGRVSDNIINPGQGDLIRVDSLDSKHEGPVEG